MVATALAAFGTGLLNGAVVVFATAYRLVWTLVARSLLFFSGVFFVVETLSPHIRDLMWWNPLLHGVIWFRAGIYGNYPTATLSYAYLAGYILFVALLGLSLERMARRRA